MFGMFVCQQNSPSETPIAGAAAPIDRDYDEDRVALDLAIIEPRQEA